MPAHPEFVAQFDAALRGGALPAGLTARDATEVERRFAVYRNNVAVSLTEALAARFPVIRRLVGAEFFAPLARLYAEAERPRSPILAEWGDGFGAFLDGFPPLSGYPYLGDVARIEYARGRAFHAADAPPVDPLALISADPEKVRLALHPSLLLLRLAHPAVSIWARNQPEGEGLPLAKGPQTALILRDAAFQVQVRALEAGDAALVTALMAGDPLAAAALAGQEAEAGHDPQPLLVWLMQAGAITDARE
ncbi:DNA-binding domain-containing protein [Tabrizicola aquatica]|uniref:HvfC/BufC N-terminal domain-containing protein n=1 Tax=Tabrizicola aquatica TaxID=909926 RepID=UPI000CD0D287|nr:putative DNA-binding domain-containing protein [Tabrizicola aquatica]